VTRTNDINREEKFKTGNSTFQTQSARCGQKERHHLLNRSVINSEEEGRTTPLKAAQASHPSMLLGKKRLLAGMKGNAAEDPGWV